MSDIQCRHICLYEKSVENIDPHRANVIDRIYSCNMPSGKPEAGTLAMDKKRFCKVTGVLKFLYNRSYPGHINNVVTLSVRVSH